MTIAQSLPRPVGRCLLVILAALWLGGCDRTSNLTDAEFLEKARALHAKGDDKSAVVEARNALQKNPKNTEARILLATIYLDAGGGKQAQNELEIALQRGANVAQTKLPMARAYLLQGNYDGAAKEAAITLSTIGSDRARLMEVEGRARMGMRQFERGCAKFEEAIAADATLVDAYWGNATCAVAKSDNDKARSIINAAIKVKPDLAKSWVLLGDIDRIDRKLDAAEKDYTHALELKKNDIDALLGRALIYAESKRLKEAEADIKVVDTVYKGHPIATYITGLIRFRQGRYPEAKTAFETTLTTAPTHFPSILWLGLTNFVQGNYELSATQLNQYVTLIPDATKVRALIALARARMGGVKQANIDLGELARLNIDDPDTLAMIGETHTFLGNSDVGSQFLARAVQLSPDSLETRVNLAAALLDKKDVAGATKQLKTILAQQADYAPAMNLMVRALVQTKDYPAALEQARAMQKVNPKDPAAADYIGSIQLLQGDRAGAESTFKALLDANPSFFPAANNLAMMAMAKGDADAARDYYQKALKVDPKSLPAMLGLHSVERSQGHAAEAEKALLAAVQTYPSEALPAQLLAQTYLSGGQPRKALDATAGAFATHSNDAGLLEVRGLAYLGLNEPAGALIAFNKLVQIRGDSANAFLYLASAQAAVGDKNAAKAALATAVKLDPADFRVRLTSGLAALNEGRVDEAASTARALQRVKADDPGGYVLEAAVFTEQKKPLDALRVLKAAAVKFPKAPAVRLALAKVQSTIGDPQGQIENLREWTRADPTNPVPLEALAEAYLRSNNEPAALEAYRAELLLAPNSTRALNNAAFLLKSRSPQEAQELAERAVRLEPSNPNLLDTLGDIQTERGAFKEALVSLQKGSDLAPKNPRLRYHLAVALVRSGQEPLARRELQRLLAASSGFEDEAKARELLNRLPKS